MKSRWDLLDHGYLTTVESWGSDERVIESARMSTSKGFQGWGPNHARDCDLFVNTRITALCDCIQTPGDEKLLRYLWTHKHTTPFEMAGLTIEVQAPLFVFREWHRHRTQSYSEQSARYVEMPELYYVPSVDRLRRGGQSTANRQASGVAIDDEKVDVAQSLIQIQAQSAFRAYRSLLDLGVAREIARVVLPVNTYSRMRASANLLNWCKFLALRLPVDAQWEIRQYARAVSEALMSAFPRTIQLALETIPAETQKAA